MTADTLALLALDLRGTLISTPRITTLIPELIEQGVARKRAQRAQLRFDREMQGPLRARGDIVDWTRYGAEWIAAALAEEGGPAINVDAVVTVFRRRYLAQSYPLVEPEDLQRYLAPLKQRCVIVADGPLERESAVVECCFGKAAWLPPLVSSECLGVNKLTSAFFARLGRLCGVAPTTMLVLGDRWDKDVLIPSRAGCHGAVVGSTQGGGSWLESLDDLVGVSQGSGQCQT